MAGGVSGVPSSPMAGGLPGLMQGIQQVEAGAQMLASQLPSLTPIIAEFVSKLRMAIPSALGANAGQGQPPMGQQQPMGGGMPGVPGPPAITGGQSLPLPPM